MKRNFFLCITLVCLGLGAGNLFAMQEDTGRPKQVEELRQRRGAREHIRGFADLVATPGDIVADVSPKDVVDIDAFRFRLRDVLPCKYLALAVCSNALFCYLAYKAYFWAMGS